MLSEALLLQGNFSSLEIVDISQLILLLVCWFETDFKPNISNIREIYFLLFYNKLLPYFQCLKRPEFFPSKRLSTQLRSLKLFEKYFLLQQR